MDSGAESSTLTPNINTSYTISFKVDKISIVRPIIPFFGLQIDTNSLYLGFCGRLQIRRLLPSSA